MPLTSMTGFATQELTHGAHIWTWDIRAVNGRGFDLKLRLPDGAEGVGAEARSAIASVIHRGSVQATLRYRSVSSSNSLDLAHIAAIFSQISAVETAARRAGVQLAPITAADLLDGRLSRGSGQEPLVIAAQAISAILGALDTALHDVRRMASAEGRQLERKITALVNRISDHVREARQVDAKRKLARNEAFGAAVRRVMHQAHEFDQTRLEQELALLALKADITEELDRLDAHVEAARDLLQQTGPVGRRLDFLTQEFNREANTLCSKAQFSELTRVGLDLKATIDQLREHIQNVE